MRRVMGLVMVLGLLAGGALALRAYDQRPTGGGAVMEHIEWYCAEVQDLDEKVAELADDPTDATLRREVAEMRADLENETGNIGGGVEYGDYNDAEDERFLDCEETFSAIPA